MIRKFVMLSLVSALAVACQQGGDGNSQTASGNESGAEKGANRSIADTGAETADLSTFMAAVEAAGLTETLRGTIPYTVFAPTNAAFEKIPAETRSGLMAAGQREQLTVLLSHHIVPGVVTAEDLGRAIERGEGGRAELATVGGGNLSVARDGDAIVITDGAGGQSRVVQADGMQSNGVIHSVDTVLMPAAAQ